MNRSVLVALLLTSACAEIGTAPDDTSGDRIGNPAVPGPSGTEVTYTVRALGGGAETRHVVLISDNGGPWRTMPATDAVHRAWIVGPRYAIARACGDALLGHAEAQLYYVTLDDGVDWIDLGCRTADDAVRLSLFVSGYPPDGVSWVQVTGASRRVRSPLFHSITVRAGLTDLIATSAEFDRRPTEQMLIARDEDIRPMSVRFIDLAYEGFLPQRHSLSVSGNAGYGNYVDVRLQTALSAPIASTIESTSYWSEYHAPPTDRLRAGDLLAVESSTSSETSRQSVTFVRSLPQSLYGVYPATYTTSPPGSIASSPWVRLSGELPVVTGADAYQVSARTSYTASIEMSWTETFSARWADGQSIEYAFPDLAGVGGWNMGVPAGDIRWSHGYRTSSTTDSFARVLGWELVDGDVVADSRATGVISVR